MTADIDAVLFDKDGCLCDFAATWDAWAAGQIAHFAAGDDAVHARLAEALCFDLERGGFRPDSPVIAGTNRDTAECIARVLPDRDVDAVERHIERAAARVRVAEVVPLAPFLGALRGQGLRLAVVTNDAEAVARAQMQSAGADGCFDVITGADSGFGAKPAAGPVLGTLRLLGVDPARAVMVGDSTHDLQAGRAAGLRVVGVLSGLAKRAELEPLADAVLPDIGDLPGWLGLGTWAANP
jgi:phosphoglycolate phosphatase